MEFLVATVFLLVGLSKIFSYRFHREPAEAGTPELAADFPYWCATLVSLFEMGVALALVTPFEITVLAAIGLALSSIITGLHRVSAQKPAAPSVALFLLVLFVICGRVL
jgi:uncharacterized membrane protein YphA (DoxX/SURF4 family)